MTTSQPPPGRWPHWCPHECQHGMLTRAPSPSSSQPEAPRTSSSSMGAQPPHHLPLLPGTLLLPSRSRSSHDS